MKTRKPIILMVGALPPPAIGPYLAMERLLSSPKLKQQFEVVFLDISDRRSIHSMGKLDLVNVWLGIRHAGQCLVRLIRRRPDVVYLGISQGIFGYLRDLTFLLPALIMRKRIVLHLRGSEFGEFYQGMPTGLKVVTRWVLAHTARVIVLGECLRSAFHGLVPENRISVIPNGIDYKTFGVQKAGGGRVAGAAARILYLAHLSRRKGLMVVLEAFAIVSRRDPAARLSIAGQWQAEDEKAEACELIRRLGIADRIEFLGEVTGQHKTQLFLGHDLFVFTPTAPEGLPWVILEAMSASLPVVTTDQGAIREVVIDGLTGRIVPAAANPVAEAVIRMLEQPPAAHAMGAAGRQRVEDHFSEDRYLDKLVALFTEVADTSSSAR